MKRVIATVKTNEFARNVITLLTGTLIAQVIPLIFSPVLTRLYSPEDFALWALYVSVTTILVGGLSTGSYEFSIMLPKSERKSKNLIGLSIIITIISSFVFLLLSLFFNDFFASILKNNDIAPFLYLVFISVFSISIINILVAWYNRKKSYTVIAGNKIYKNVGIVFINLALGLFSLNKLGLILGQIGGELIGALQLISKFKLQNIRNIFRNTHYKILKKIALEYKDFPMYSMVTSILNNVSNQLPVLLISMWFSASLTGLYFLALRILSTPMSFIGASVSQTFFQKFTEMINNRDAKARIFIVRIWVILFGISFIPLLVVFFFGGDIFGFVFGDSWKDAGNIASILSPMILFTFISSPTSSSFISLRLQHLYLIFGVISLIYRPFSFYIGYRMGDFYLGLKILVVCECVYLFFFNFIIWLKLGSFKTIK